jgi:hypothetical protein
MLAIYDHELATFYFFPLLWLLLEKLTILVHGRKTEFLALLNVNKLDQFFLYRLNYVSLLHLNDILITRDDALHNINGHSLQF